MVFSWFSKSSPDPSSFAKIGDWGEEYAAFQLARAGLKILGRNKRYSCGELDIVAGRSRWFQIVELIFCEVKTRQSRVLRAAEAVTPDKQERLQRAAKRYLFEWQSEHPLTQLSCRFDVVEVYFVDGVVEFRWTENAFEVDPEIFMF